MTERNISFDRAAGFYDQTRKLAGSMATIGIQTILDLAGPHGSILEVGIGTGRIGVPLLQRGANLIGCDLSIEMMHQLHDKFPTARLVRSDAVRLPFPADRFDALITIHVLHLVGAWRIALRGFKRVLKSNGVYINSWHWHDSDSIDHKVRQHWRDQIEARGFNWRRPGIQSREELIAELKTMGARVEEKEIARGLDQTKPREILDGLTNRVFSDTWDLPEDVLSASIRETHDWAIQELGDIDRPIDEEFRIILDVARF
ncbi:MAG TPA: class I SAM-dependent methyltransferase [Anaerolineae bacterium]|nr:class I SAM-dependent methyltransferase [Anaerolineae bacterium]